MGTRPAINISAVDCDSGLGKDTLRVRERRYGFYRVLSRGAAAPPVSRVLLER